MRKPPSTDMDALFAAARNDLATFAELGFEAATGRSDFVPNWNIDAICFALEQVESGQITRSIINAPPRFLKSHLASVAFPLWILGRNPNARIMCISYGDSLVEAFGRQRTRVIESGIFNQIFPNVRWARNDRSMASIGTTAGGSIRGFSMSGPVTGRGCDVMIIDDPMKAEDIHSQAARRSAFEAFRTSLFSRFNDRKKGAIVLVMQRLHTEDLTGMVQRLCDWEKVSIPLLSTKPEVYQLKNGIYRRPKGTLIHPERYGMAELEEDKRVFGIRGFSAQFQQEPLPEEGSLVKLEWFRRYDQVPDRSELPLVVLSVDPASSADPGADYSVISAWGVTDDRCYLLDLIRGQFTVPVLRKRIVATMQKWQADRALIEYAGSGIGLVQDFRDGDTVPVKGIKPKGSKQLRLLAVSPLIERRLVAIPNNAPWLPEFLSEILAFPHSGKDDQVDSVSQFLQWYTWQLRSKNRGLLKAKPTPATDVAPPQDANSGGRSRVYDRIGRDSEDEDLYREMFANTMRPLRGLR